MMKSIAGTITLLVIPAPGLAVTVAGLLVPAVRFDPLPMDGGFDFTVARNATPGATPDAFAALAVVPEPRVWLLLVAGYGMVGFALRRRGLLRHVAG